MLVKKLLKIDRLCILNDASQVLESRQRVLLRVQHLLGRFLHVAVRLLGEHPAAAPRPSAAPSRRGAGGGEWREWAGRRLARATHSLPNLAGPGAADSSQTEAGAATSVRLALPGALGSGHNMADPFSSRARSWGDLGRPPPPPPASCGRSSLPQAGPGRGRGGGAPGVATPLRSP